jgi:hypothetical protein
MCGRQNALRMMAKAEAGRDKTMQYEEYIKERIEV